MATPIDNAQYADSLFSNLRQSAGRYMDAQVQIAARAEQERKQREMMNLKRVQEIQDQQTEAEMRKALVAQQVDAQRDIANLQLTRDDARWKAAQTREDTKVDEAEKKAVIANVRAAYEKYKADGGAKKLAEFGAENLAETIYAIQNAHQEVVAESTKRRFAQFGQNLMDRERQLAASVEPDEKELSAIKQDAIAFVSGDATQSNAAEYYAKLAAKNPEAAYTATVQRFPAFGAAVEAQVQRGSSAMRAEKAKSPEFIKNLQSLSVDRQTITEAAVKNPYGDAFFEAIKPLPVGTPGKKQADLSNLGGKPATDKKAAAPKAPASTEPAALSPAGIVRDQGAGGVLNLMFNPTAAPMIAARQALPVVAPVVAGADRLASSALASLYNLRPTTMDKGFATQAGEALGNLYPNPYAK